MIEKRVRTFKTCPMEGCDWQLVTSWMVGTPDTVELVPQAEQERYAGLHMKNHYTPERTHLT